MPHSVPTSGARAILDAATALFAEEGFDCVSVAAIAAQAGVCKANVFHHYESKEALYLAVMRQASAEHADYAELLYGTQTSSADKIRKLIEFEICNMLRNEQRTRLMMRENTEAGHAQTRKLARQVFQRNFTAVVNIFEQGRASGEFHSSIDPAASAMLLHGATNLFFSCREAVHEFRETRELQSPAIYAARVAALILGGVLTPTAVPEAAAAAASSQASRKRATQPRAVQRRRARTKS